MNKKMKKFLSFISSLKVAIFLLILIAIYIVIGTMLPQHGTQELYEQRYPTISSIIITLHLDKAYSSPIFLVLISLFVINLISCTILSLKGQFHVVKKSYFPTFVEKDENKIENVGEQEFLQLVKNKSFHIVKDDAGGYKGGKYRFGSLGAMVTHIGILIIFIGAVVSNMSAHEDMISLLPGNTEVFPEYGLQVSLDDFYMTFDENNAITQYYSDLSITKEDGTIVKEKIWVNNPLHINNLGFYQANFGWTSNLVVRDINTDEIIVEGLLRNQKSYFHQPHHLNISLFAYFPDMIIDHEQMPYSKSNKEVNPFYAVVLYQFGNPVGSYILSPGQEVIFEDIAISFTHSVAYTGLVVRNDPSYPVVLTGFIILLLGMFISFYLYPRFIMYKDGMIIVSSKKNRWVFHHAMMMSITELRNKQSKKKEI
jgi:cytochrome c biogenesis protein